MQTGEAKVDRKQTASPVASKRGRSKSHVHVISSRSKRHRARQQASCAGLFLDNFIIPFEMSTVRIKIIIVALVIGLVWGGGRDSDKDSQESTSHLFITASEEQ